MESWNKIDNSLINLIDSKAADSEPKHTSLKNTLKTILKLMPNQYLNTNAVYNKKFLVDIPKTCNNLSGLFVKFTLALTATPVVETGIAAQLCKRIILRTVSGTVLQQITPRYTSARLEELYNSSLYTHISPGITLSSSAATSYTLFLPLFLFFSESTNTFLATRQLEPLQLVFETNDTDLSMGITTGVLSQLDIVVYASYFDEHPTSRSDTQLNAVKSGIPKQLYGSYNIFEEDQLALLSGSTTAKLLLRCPYPVFAIHVSIYDSTTKIRTVTNLKITTRGAELINLDYRINYDLFSDIQSLGNNGPFSLFFSKLKSRTEDSGLITFSGPMFPSYLELEFSALSADCTLSVICEYRTNYEVSDQGRIKLVMDSNMDQQNSYQGPANLTG